MERNFVDHNAGDAGGSQPGAPTSRFLPACLGCFAGTLVFWLVVLLVFSLAAGSFVRYGVSTDLAEYRKTIRDAEIDEAEKKQVIDKIESIRQKVRDGKSPGFWRWLEHSESIKGLIENQRITTEDVEEVLRELEDVEKSLE